VQHDRLDGRGHAVDETGRVLHGFRLPFRAGPEALGDLLDGAAGALDRLRALAHLRDKVPEPREHEIQVLLKVRDYAFLATYDGKLRREVAVRRLRHFHEYVPHLFFERVPLLPVLLLHRLYLLDFDLEVRGHLVERGADAAHLVAPADLELLREIALRGRLDDVQELRDLLLEVAAPRFVHFDHALEVDRHL